MAFLYYCGIMCALISLWGALQLSVMSILYYVEAVLLIEDCEAHDVKEYEQYLDKTKKNYKATATNCLIAAVIYVLTLVLSIVCIWKANKSDRLKAAQLEDDEASCLPPPSKPEVMVSSLSPKTSLFSRILGRNKDKQQTQVVAKQPTGALNIKDSETTEEYATSGGSKKKKKEREGRKIGRF